MNRIKLTKDFEISRVVHGHWRSAEWNLSPQALLQLATMSVELGVTTFDHADIYGNYTCEELFGNALKLNGALRHNIEIITKCGIKLRSERFPERKLKIYDYGYDHITSSVNNSLKNLGTDYIDLLLLHRPAPFFEPEAVARAFSDLKRDGKVRYFGVSNFNPDQFRMLSSYLDEKLVTNQVEISPFCLDHFDNGNIDFFLLERLKPMAWSPLAGGRLFSPRDEKGHRVEIALREVAAELNVDNPEKVVYAWLLKHPASIIPVAGTRQIERVRYAVDALNVNMSLEQWYKIYIASRGEDLP